MKKFTAAVYLLATVIASGPIPGQVLGQDEISVPTEEFTFLTERLKELEKLEDEIKTRATTIDELQSTIAGLKAEIDEKDRQIDEIQALSSKVEALQTENSELEQDIETREARITELQSKNSDLNKQIAHMKEIFPKPRPRPEPPPATEPPTTATVDPPDPPPPPVVKPSPPSFQRLATNVEGYQFNRSGQKLPDGRTRIFQVDVTISDPISQREYRKFCRQSSAVRCPSGISDSGDPVTGISWNEANAYMRWLSRHTRQSYRFPWYQEIAARPTLGNEWSSQYGASAQVVSTSGQPADATLVPLGQRRTGTGFRLAIE